MSNIPGQLKNYLEMLKAGGVDFVPKMSSSVIARRLTEPAKQSQSEIASPDRPSGTGEPSGRPPLNQPATLPITLSHNDIDDQESLSDLKHSVLQCVKCAELASKRKNVVFGSGNSKAQLVFVGEAPGQDEDLQGLPFVGKAGQLLTKIIESIGQSRESVFICNVLKCRPPGNRNPLPQEIFNCEPYLIDQINLIQPKVICALGTFAAQTLLKTEKNISSLRGKFYDYHGSKLLCTFHPAYLLRNPEEKRKVWEDMKMIRAELASTPSELRPNLPLERSAPTGELTVGLEQS